MDFFNFIKDNKFWLILASILVNILLIILCIFLYWQKINANIKYDNVPKTIEVAENNDTLDEKFYVEIKGAVKNPGVYEAQNNNIINDIVKQAGGFTKTAYTNNINLSRKVSSELVIYVYTKTEYKDLNTIKEKEDIVTCECPTYDISDCLQTGTSEIISNNNIAATDNIEAKDSSINENQPNNSNDITSETKLININTATKEELTTLSGIGESKAEDIINYRSTNGLFKNIAEIKNVSGIGEALYEKIKNSITI